MIFNEMVNLLGETTDVIHFININIRNMGTLVANNGVRKRRLVGTSVHVYPGGLLQSTFLEVVTDTVVVDVLGAIEVNGAGYGSEGISIVFPISVHVAETTYHYWWHVQL